MARQNRYSTTSYKTSDAHLRNEQVYVHGNTVRQAEALPQRREERRDEERRSAEPKRVSRQRMSNRKKALHMSFGYVTFLAAAAIVGLLVCVQFLQLRAEVTSRSSNITSMQRELSTLHEQNTTRYNAVMDTVNLEEIQVRAIELGMVYAQEGQIIEYDNPSNDYVKQHQSIPQSGVLVANERISE